MGSSKALQEWCRIQCEDYSHVEIRDMSSSFRDGLAFCAIIHRHRPDSIDFDSSSKENVYENNRSAFEVAESESGIPASSDPEDMVSMKVPDRSSVITYVSQYYNFFNNKSQANPPSMKRSSTVSHNEPAQKRPPTPLGDKSVDPETGAEVVAAVKRSTSSSSCAACQKHVHSVQRFLIDGKLYHRNCFRCTECRSTSLPGSYRGNDSGSLVCTHHLSRQAPANQNGRPDLSKKPEEVQSSRTGRSAALHPVLSESNEAENPSPAKADAPPGVSVTATAGTTSEERSLDEEKEESRPSSPPNPFDESDEEEDEEGKEEEIQAKETSNGDLPPTSDVNAAEAGRPVPAPRKASDATPPPRPAPRVRLSCTTNTSQSGEHVKPPTAPKPRERSQSPGSGTHKPKDPPWLASVQSETKRKKAPPPPPPGTATPPDTGSSSSLQAEGSGRSTPPQPPNPFEDEDDEVNEEGSDGGTVPPTVVATHPWYSITQPSDAAGSDATPTKGSSSRSASPGSAKSKKRPAPRVPPQPHGAAQAHSQPSSCSPSPALSVESSSSSSDHSSSQLPSGASASNDQEQSFTKSVSEPSICSPGDNPSSSPSADHLNSTSQSSCPSPMSSNASSAPATPQTSRNAGAKPPRPTTTPSPSASQSHNKRFCKENPFNRKASPSDGRSESRPSKGARPARPPAPGHGFPLIKRKVQSDQYIPIEDIHAELSQSEKQSDESEQSGVESEKKSRDGPNDEEEERLSVDWFTSIHDKHHLVRREAESVYTAKQQNSEERQADVEYESRCLLNKPEKDWTEEDKSREQELMAELVTIIEQRNQIVNSMDQERQREEEEDKLMEAMSKKKDFHKDPEDHHQKKKGNKFKPIKVSKRSSHKGEAGKSHSPRKDKS